jgi:protein-S-isoprenylcysteine O-methyltransferase Ste14
MHAIDVIIPVVWVAFWVYWIVAAFRTKTTRSRNASSLPIRGAILVLILLSFRVGVFKGNSGATIHNPWLLGAGLAVFLAGLALAVWARIYLGRNWGTPMSQKVDPELVTTGPYRFVRHPIYSGIILGMIGTTMAISLYWLIAVGLLGAYFIYSATVEERNMERLFPETYPAYKRSTKMLVPFIF